MVCLTLLGPVDIPGKAGVPRPQFGTPRLRCLLAALALRANAVADVDWLAEILWADTPPANPESGVHNLVFRLRSSVARRQADDRLRIVTTAPGYTLVVDRAEIDSLLFTDTVGLAAGIVSSDPQLSVSMLADAEKLWRGTPFGEFADTGWVRAEVQALLERRVRGAETAADALVALGRPADAYEKLIPFVDGYPYREGLHLRLMTSLWRMDRAADALDAYQWLRRRLAADLGTDPARSVSDLHTRILAGETAEERGRDPARESHPNGTVLARQTVPQRDPDGLVGRRDELALLDAALPEAARPGVADSDRRVLTIVGPGGVGKTTLIRHHARARSERPVWFAELAAAQHPGAVVHGVVSATGLPMRRDLQALDALTDALGTRSGLLVLDNCEHVLDGAAEVALAVHDRCPKVRIVATSRVPLGLSIEQILPLGPLPVPEVAAPPADIAASDAVRLFCQRAQARDPRFELTDSTAPAVAEICRRLDGLPLGVELAATKARAIPPDVLVERLHWRFRILRGSRAAEPRHRSLHALVDWSYGLLGEPARALFDVLSVFPSRFDLDDAEYVASTTGVLDRRDVADAVAELVDASMLTTDAGSYLMLETLRAFGVDQLIERDALPVVRRAHAEWVSAWLGRLGVEVYGHGHIAAARRVEARLDDVRQAIDHVCAHDIALAGPVFEGVIPYLELTMNPEVNAWASRVIAAGERDSDGTARVGAAVWAVSAGGARFDGDLPTARGCVQKGLDAGPGAVVRVYLHMLLVEVGLFQGDLDAALADARTFRELALDAGMIGAAHMSDVSALLIRNYQGDNAFPAIRILGAACSAAGEDVVAGWCRYVSGECLLDADPSRARHLLDDAIGSARRNGDRYLLGVAMVSRASIEARHGNHHRAAELYVDVLRHWRQTGNWTNLWVTLRSVAELLLALQHTEAAGFLLGAIHRAGELAGADAFGDDAERLRAAEEQVRGQLGDTAAEELVGRGAALTSPDAVDLALAALGDEC